MFLRLLLTAALSSGVVKSTMCDLCNFNSFLNVFFSGHTVSCLWTKLDNFCEKNLQSLLLSTPSSHCFLNAVAMGEQNCLASTSGISVLQFFVRV